MNQIVRVSQAGVRRKPLGVQVIEKAAKRVDLNAAMSFDDDNSVACGTFDFEHPGLDEIALSAAHPTEFARHFDAVHIIDASKEIIADFRHRALRHHAEGIFMAETIFGVTITLSSSRIIPTRWVGEQHVTEDLGFIPSFADWVRSIRPEPWMGRTQKIEADVDPRFLIREITHA